MRWGEKHTQKSHSSLEGFCFFHLLNDNVFGLVILCARIPPSQLNLCKFSEFVEASLNVFFDGVSTFVLHVHSKPDQSHIETGPKVQPSDENRQRLC
jgi:hypothetical protein